MKKKVKESKTSMTAREVAVLIEELRGQFKVFSESLDDIGLKVDSVFNQVGTLTEDSSIVKTDIGCIKTDIAEIKDTIKSHAERISRLEAVK